MLERSVRLVELRFGLHTGRARLAVIPDVSPKTWSIKIMSDKTYGLILP